MADRDFPFIKTTRGGQAASAFRIVCGGCETSEDFVQNSGRRSPAKAAEQHFRNKGWVVGRVARMDRCPECRPHSLPTPELTIVKTDKAIAIVPPREMSREDKRIIFAKLNEVYVGEDKGYSAGWTDANVARDLGIPRAWVETVRDEMFGPAKSNDEIRAFMEEAAPIVAEMRNLHRSIDDAIDRAKAVGLKVDAFEKRLGKIEKAVA